MAGNRSPIRRGYAAPLVAVMAMLVGLLFCTGSARAIDGKPPYLGYNDDFNQFELHTTNPFDQIIKIPGLPLPGDKTDEEAIGGPLMDLAKAGGADVVRYVVPWLRVERHRGSYDWEIEDETYQLALQRGLKPLIVIHTSPCWAHPSIPCDPDSYRAARPDRDYLDDFARFAKATIKRYPEAVGFEIWNESNLKPFWGADATPRSYAAMLKAVHEETGSLGNHDPVIFNGLTPKPSSAKYLKRAMAKFGAADAVDATALHPYVGGKGVLAIRKRVKTARKILRKAKARRAIWVTEVGWSTHPEALTGITTAQQAARIDQLVKVAPKLNLKSVIIHRLVDISGSSPWEEGLGVLDIDEKPKPIFCALGINYGLRRTPDGC